MYTEPTSPDNPDRDFKNWKKAQDLLLASETRYRRLFEAAHDGILILDAGTGQIVDANPFLINLLGFSHEQFLGKKIWEIGPFKDIVANKDNFEELQRKESIRYEDLPLETADGKHIAVEFVSNVYMVDNKKVIQCNIRDITERKKIESALNTSEVQYRRLFEAAQDGILILDAGTGQIVEANPFLINLLGFSHEQFLGKRIWEIGPFKDIVANKDNFEELQRKEYIRYEDLPLETADGRNIAVEFVSNVYMVNDRKVIQCNIRNITERKLVELERARLAAIEEYSEDAIIAKTMDGIITSWNNGAERIYRYSAQEIVGRNISLLDPSVKMDDTQLILERIRNGEPVIRYETMRRKKDGGLINISLTASQIRNARNDLIGVTTIAHDITKRKLAEEALNATETRYRRLFETAQDGILILDAETGQIVEVNPFLITFLGFSHEQFLGKKIWEIGLFKDIIANKDNFEELQQKESIRYENLPLETADGRNIAVEFVSNVYIVNDKKVIQCNIRDITERKKMMEQIEASLAEKETLLHEIRILANAIPDEVMLLDKDQNIIVLNDAMAKRSGYNYTPVYGEAAIRFDRNGMFSSIESPIRELLRSGQPVRFEEKNQDKWFEISLILISGADEQNPRVFVQYHDITDHKRFEELLKKEGITQLEQNMEQFQILNDQIRNPLQAIMGYVNLDCNRYRERIMEQIELVDTLVDRLDRGWVESEKVRHFLLRHYQYNPDDVPDPVAGKKCEDSQ